MQLVKHDVRYLNQQPTEDQVGEGGFKYAASPKVIEQAEVGNIVVCIDNAGVSELR